MRIGILIKKFDALQNWELRIIEIIKNDPNFELVLLIKDGRDENDSQFLNKKNLSLSNRLLNGQVLIEKKRYLINLQVVKKTGIINYLNTIPTLEVEPKRDGKLDVFSLKDSQKVKNYNLDVILKHEFKIISGKILNTSKHGIWYISHSNISLNRGGISGFWEVLLKKSVVSVSLIQLDLKDACKANIIDKAYYNRNLSSSVITNYIIKESSVTLLFKYLREIDKNEKMIIKDKINFSSLYISPNINYTVKYLFGFYSNYLKGKIRKNYTSLDVRNQRWTLFIGKGNFMESDLTVLKQVELPRDEFWADPFLFMYQDEYYVFFENYSYTTKRGKICCGKVKNDQLVDIIDLLDLDYHLSYPFIFKEDDEIYLMPETSENKRLEIYKCISFPDQWELYSTAFEGETVQDTTLYIDEHNQKWLFLNKVSAPNMDRTSELYIYRIDTLKLNNLEAHKQNPVLIDSRVARNGGAIFKYKNKIYRPSQSNTDGVYGKALNINQIKKLTINEYDEEVVRVVNADFLSGLVSIHHLHQIEEMFVIDAALR